MNSAARRRRRAARSLSLAAALTGFAWACSGGEEPPRAARAPGAGGQETAAPAAPNLVLVTVDTLRADHSSAYGYPRPTTPHLEALAREGTLFERAYAPVPTTLPSHATLFSSRYPSEHRARRNGDVLGDEVETLAELLRARGYATAAFVSSYVLHRRFGLAQGFDVYDDAFDPGDAELADERHWAGHDVTQPFDRRAQATGDAARAWLAGAREPFFLWVHYFDPHQPLRPPEPYAAQFRRDGATTERERVVDGYDAEVRYTDEALGQLTAAVEARAGGARTLLVVTADHGEGLWDHGWLEHGVLLYEEAVRVPLVWRWPGQIAAGRRIEPPVGLVDALPTVLGLLGIDAGDRVLRGVDLAPVLLGRAEPDPDRRVFMERRLYTRRRVHHRRVVGPVHALRWREWKLIRSPQELGVELFHLERDPHERENAAGLHPALLRSLARELDTWERGLDARAAAPETLPDDVRQRLEALGYTE